MGLFCSLVLHLAAGRRPPRLNKIWGRPRIDEDPVPVPISDGRLEVAIDAGSAAPKFGSRWSWILSVSCVEVYVTASGADGWGPDITCCLASCLRLELSHTWVCRLLELKFNQKASVDEDGYAALDWEDLGELGRLEDNPIILNFSTPQEASVVQCGLLGVSEAVCPVPLGYLKGWSELPLIQAWRQHPALQQKKSVSSQRARCV